MARQGSGSQQQRTLYWVNQFADYHLEEVDADKIRAALNRYRQENAWSVMAAFLFARADGHDHRHEEIGAFKARLDGYRVENSLAFLYDTKNGEPRACSLPMPTLAEMRPFRGIGTALVFPSLIKPEKPFEFKQHWKKALLAQPHTIAIPKCIFHPKPAIHSDLKTATCSDAN